MGVIDYIMEIHSCRMQNIFQTDMLADEIVTFSINDEYAPWLST